MLRAMHQYGVSQNKLVGDPMQHRLSLIQKFMILGILALVIAAIPAALYFANTFKQQEIATLEKRGSAPLIALNKVIQLSQTHRGM
jgi:hypothetical protein